MRALALLVLAACGRDHFDPAHNVAFVTSTVHDPVTFGSDGAGADAICAQTASAAGLVGDYRAYVATTSVPAPDHLGNARGWIRTDGKPVADLVADLQTGHLLYPLRLDENGDDQGPVTVATGAQADGSVSLGGNCSDWANAATNYAVGIPAATGGAWAASGGSSCASVAHLYCFGVGMSSPLGVEPASGRLAFVTIQAYVPTAGLAGADALCASEATAASLPGTFLALLGTGSASAASRFDMTGPTWVRTDGIPLADSPLAFVDGDLLTAPSVTALGTETKVHDVLTGGSLGTPSGGNCGNWTGTGINGALIGNAERASNAAFDSTNGGCNGGPIYCLAE